MKRPGDTLFAPADKAKGYRRQLAGPYCHPWWEPQARPEPSMLHNQGSLIQAEGSGRSFPSLERVAPLAIAPEAEQYEEETVSYRRSSLV